MAQIQLFGGVLLFFFALLILIFASQNRRGHKPILRYIDAFAAVRRLAAQSIEAGQHIHYALGTGGLTNQTMADTLAGLTMLDYIASRTAPAGVSPIVTTSDPIVALVVQSRLQHFGRTDYGRLPQQVAETRWISPMPAAYAAGAMTVIASENVAANVLIGHFGDEYLLVAEAGKRQPALTTVAGSSDPTVLPFVQATTSRSLWGEELFAAGAYLTNKATHLGSLVAQDTIRWIIGLVILGSILVRIVT